MLSRGIDWREDWKAEDLPFVQGVVVSVCAHGGERMVCKPNSTGRQKQTKTNTHMEDPILCLLQFSSSWGVGWSPIGAVAGSLTGSGSGADDDGASGVIGDDAEGFAAVTAEEAAAGEALAAASWALRR